jgi:hypothetical protein
LCKHKYCKHVVLVVTERTQIDDLEKTEKVCGSERHTRYGKETLMERNLLEKLGIYGKIRVLQN